MSSLEEVTHDDFRIVNNDALDNVDGLLGLRSIGVSRSGPGGQAFEIDGNYSLRNLDGLSNVVSLAHYSFFHVTYNHNLENVDGLRNVELLRPSWSWTVNINNNYKLANIAGLSVFKKISNLGLYNNSVLSDCSAFAIALGWPNGLESVNVDRLSLFGNSFSCNSVYQIYRSYDSDSDGISNAEDNCPDLSNSSQADADTDGAGDACDAFPSNPDEQADADSDGVGDNGDNCPAATNADQADADGDTQGNACDLDDDNDGVDDADDAFPLDPSEQSDTDEDGTGDNGDNCPEIANSDQLNSDSDVNGNACDADDDNDGLTDIEETGLGTNPLKSDTDGDGWSDKEEIEEGTDPLLATSQPELEGGLPIWLLYEATQ